MGLSRSRIYIINFIFTALAGVTAHAQPQPQMSYCLSAAQEIQVAAFKKNKKYLLEESELKSELPLGCRNYPYVVSLKGTDGFRVSAEIGGEVWGVDEKYAFVRLARAGSKTAPLTLPNKPAAKDGKDPKDGKAPPEKTAQSTPKENSAASPPTASPPTASPPTASPPKQEGLFSSLARAAFGGSSGATSDQPRVPMAILASDAVAAGPPGPKQDELKPFDGNSGAGGIATLKSQDDAKTKFKDCFTKTYYGTNFCSTLFDSLTKECAKGGEKLPVNCVEFTRRVAEVRIDDCRGEEDNYGGCEEKARRLAKLCQNPLKQLTAECRALNKYRERVAAESPPANRAPAQSNLFAVIETTSLEAIRNVRTLEPALRKLLTLRPVSFEFKDGSRKDVGFVADEVEVIDRNLVTYLPNGKVQGVRYQALTTLLTSGLQDLYGVCKSDLDLNKELIQKVIVLQDENAELKKKFERQQLDLLMIKEKLGIK